MTADELKRSRVALGLTQEELGRELKVAANTVARWERGERKIPPMAEVALFKVQWKKGWLDLLTINGGSLPASYDWETKVVDIVEDVETHAATFTLAFTRTTDRDIRRKLQLRVHSFTLIREKDQSPRRRPDGVIRTIINWLWTDEDDGLIDYEAVEPTTGKNSGNLDDLSGR